MKSVRAVLVVAGWADIHIDALQRAKGIELIALCDADAKRGAAVAKNAKIPRSYPNLGGALAQTDVDLVSIALPPALQKEIALQAIAAKKHVLCEAPLGLNVREAQALFEAARACGVMHGVALQTRYLPSFAYAKELIDEDYLGTFLRAVVNFTIAQAWGANGDWQADEARGGGILTDVAVHFIDALRWWFGPVEAVMADRHTLFPEIRVPVRVGNDTKYEKWKATADDAFLALLKFEKGGMAVLNFVSGARQDAGWTVSLYGSRGALTITSGALGGMQEGEREWGLHEIPRRLELPERPREPLMWALARLSEELAAQIRGDKIPQPPPDFRDGAQNLKIIDAIKRSADDMRWVGV